MPTTTLTAPATTGETDTEEDLFDLDISLIESGPVIPELMRSTSDNCGKTCASACTSCKS
ncbi:FxLD family lanthipeptide [Micromonospora craniellae]|uniref:FxLD family lantipeptide n=1 Tax=Micromonospora craniellae TaxID=2294034 RepID=A0A372FR42_9ACTN|nr:FxLD family lanthipeptide [Micromonospora craniellae]QOC94415.1 FxLD family lanthipeptide [Micromonospora craniellae]RFS43201.1 FxLD family lantipeptide [Micromonospora craniellae]